ncbi:MAG: NAD+ synthase [Bacteroidota bacterium]|jgi:NAD+ synthase|nr:NAD+ synthase [Bacteroidota bacterium]
MLPQLKLDASATVDLLCGFITAEFDTAGFSRAIVGLSGGIDSALTATLCVRALGPRQVSCIMMPHRDSSAESVEHARLVAGWMGVEPDLVDITPVVDPLIAGDPTMNRLRRGNIMARTRMIVLYDRSARDHGLVVGTGNKTEALLGYSTLFGDAACAINPLGDLYKTQVRQLSAWLGIPDAIIQKPPSADLWSGQTDEDELGFTYDRVDALLVSMIDGRVDDAGLAALGFEPEFIAAVRARIVRQRFKRMLPTIARIGARPVNADILYPDTWGI